MKRKTPESDVLTLDSLTWSKHEKDSTNDLIQEANAIEKQR